MYENALQDQKLLRRFGQVAVSALFKEQEVLNAHAELARDVDARLDRYDRARRDRPR